MRSTINCTQKEKRTKSNFKDECDINKLMERYRKTGQLPDMIKKDPQYGDFSNVVSFQEAQSIIIKAELQFLNLSAHLRNRFENSPKKFLEFVENPKNKEEMIKMGLIKKPEVIQPDVKPEKKEDPKLEQVKKPEK